MKTAELAGLTAAYIGDAVFELKMRTKYHNHAEVVRRVCARAQAEAVERILPVLSEEELQFYKRGRNAKVNTIPQHATVEQYHKATGLEALFGYLYNEGRTERIDELFHLITD